MLTLQVAEIVPLQDDYAMSPESQFRAPGIDDPGLPRLTVAAVARRLGIAPGTLRTWDRRYGLGPTEHFVGEHRRYSKEDLARLLYMHKLVISGVSPADAAKLAVSHAGSIDEKELAEVSAVDENLVASLFRTAQVLDRRGVEDQLRLQIDRHGVGLTWINVLVPLLCSIGEEWERTGSGIAAEHMVTDVIKKVFAEKTDVAQPRNEVPVLLACVGEEMHSLAISALAAALAEESIQVQFLGARTPVEAIAEVIRRSAPPAIFLWAQLPENASPEILSELPAVRPAPRVILGGPGWDGFEPVGAVKINDLASACREISDALGL